MQYGTRMLNDWQELKSKYPTQINAVTIVDANGNQGSFMHIRTKLFNHLIRKIMITNVKTHQSVIFVMTNFVLLESLENLGHLT